MRRIIDLIVLALIGGSFLFPVSYFDISTIRMTSCDPTYDIFGFERSCVAHYWSSSWIAFLPALLTATAALVKTALRTDRYRTGIALIASASGAVALIIVISRGVGTPYDLPFVLDRGFWLFLFGLLLIAWSVLQSLSSITDRARHGALLVPLLFGLCLLYLWQISVVAFGIPQILLPAPSQIGSQLVSQASMLWADFQQTFLKSVLAGFAMGCGLGFIVAVLTDRVPFLQRGLLPLGNMVSAVPIVGIAPIMVMWFGFGWESKAAVIVVMTFFPMLINTIAGLNASDHMSRDLMRSYGSSYWQTFFMLRLPAALPFVFNALKINSTLALIGAIVAEMFGSPISGMGFRISTEVYKMNVDIVWATIAVAAVAGSAFYGALALIERRLTFWHPSYRSKLRSS